MKIQELEFYEGGGFIFDEFTVITSSPQTSSRWLVQSLVERYGGSLIECGVQRPELQNVNKDFVVLTNLELPVLSGHITANELVSLVKSLRDRTAHLAVCITLSDALIDSYYNTGSQLARLASRLLYEAELVVQLQPLATGRAQDITGRFVVARGPRASSRTVIERELFYHVGIRGNVELNANT